VHVDEDLELYALGVLSDEERARVEAHVAACSQCSARLGDAEAVVAKLALAYPPSTVAPLRLARIASPWIAAAAAFVLAVGITLAALLQTHRLQAQVGADDAVLATIATSHFNHAEFSKTAAGAPAAKVLNARDGAWLYVIVDAPLGGVHVVGRHDDTAVDFGAVRVHGNTATLFVRDPGTMSRLELRRDGATIGTAVPSYRSE
jgi:anti-sigma factor RsiW